MPEVEASSKNLRRFFKYNIQFQMMLFAPVGHLFLHMESLVLQYGFSLTVSVEPRPSVHGNFLNETRFCGQFKTTLRNKTAKQEIMMRRDTKKIISIEIRVTK